ncbi:neuronal PAS domain-containing protein 1 [Engraulis encrasicolus]|uniref:neuronal PAS domain-containing protein 1 n=1 Tax=Engraulis encrasicolus TaxID=184585 RepID=UPI002FD5EC9B
MASMPFVSEGKCVSVEWDFLQGLLAKPPTLPCLQNLRKEKSRNAARSRRGKENFEFFELAKMLPLPGAITSQLDKASVIRLTISYLHMRTFASQGDPPWTSLMEGENSCSKAVSSLDGFVFVVSKEGRFLYISETVSIYLGLSQVELTGSSVFDYIHPADHVEMAERLGLRPHLRAEAGCQTTNESPSSSASTPSLAGTPEPGPCSPITPGDELLERGFFIRMKSTLTKRGLHVKSSGYKVIHVTGRIRCRPALVPSSAHRSLQRPMGLVVLAHTLPPSTLNEVRMESHMFVFRVNMDLQVTYCENRISEYMDLSPAEVVGQTCYHFIHVEDLDNIRQSHEDLLRKGQVVTGYYRWLQRRGGYLWVQSCATVSINHKAPHERNIIWVNYVLSRTEMPDMALDLLQLPEGLRAERLERASSSPHSISSKGSGVSQTLKSSKLEAELKHREAYAHSAAAIQSDERKKRARRHSPSPDDRPPPTIRRRLQQEFRPHRADSPVAPSSEPGSESEGEEEEEEEETEREAPSLGSNGGVSGGVNGGGGGGGASVGVVGSSVSTGGRWSSSSHTPTPGSLAEASSPPSSSTPAAASTSEHPPTLNLTDTPPKPPHLYPPPPPPSVSPPYHHHHHHHHGLWPPSRGQDDRAGGVLGCVSVGWGLGGGGGGGRSASVAAAADFDLLQRLTAAAAAAAAGAGAASSGRVLFHPLALASAGGPPQGPQSLYAPSTIRYAPPELPPHHPHHPHHHHPHHPHPHPHPAAAFFPHLQRIAALPPFSGFSASEAAFSGGLPFCMSGLRGAAGPEED